MSEPSEIMAAYPQVPCEAVRWLWHSLYYDGPLTGLVEYGGERLWVACFDDCDGPGPDGQYPFFRRYTLKRLTPEAMAAEVERHECFRQYVGHHTDYVHDPDGKCCRAGDTHPQKQWQAFYDRYPPGEYKEPDGEIIGWFEE